MEPPRTDRGRKTRQALLDAAEIEFGAQGYAAASVVDIAKRAGTAHGSFYTYFESKETIFAELVRGLSDRLRTEIAAAVDGLDDRLAIERAGIEAFFSFIQRHRALYRIVRQAEFVDEALFRWYYRRIADGYVRGLRAAADRGQVALADPDTVAWCLMGMADFVGMRWVLWEGQPPPRHVVDAMLALVSTGLAPPR
ncbi:MAG: TetR/AcrR family transcriptional regulator [Myxococcota bacterium]